MMVMIRQNEIMSKLAQLAGPLAKSSCGWRLGTREEWSLVRLSEFLAHVDPKLFNAFWLWSEEPSPCNLHVFLD